jgi:archaellum biogenesis protein FlaJ (TadC family)
MVQAVLDRILATWTAWQGNITMAAAIVALSLVGSILLVVWVLARLPEDYLLSTRVVPVSTRPPLARWAIAVLRNAAGVVLVAAGLVMSVPGVPGQGVLTIVVGLLLIDLPLIRRLERRLMQRRRMLRSINGIRARLGKKPLQVDDPS